MTTSNVTPLIHHKAFSELRGQVQAFAVLFDLGTERLDLVIDGLATVLERVGPNSSDAEVIKRAVGRLDEIAWEISDVAVTLREANFSFGKIKI